MDTLQCWSDVLLDAVCALNQCQYMVLFLFIVRIHTSRNQGVEMGVTFFAITPSDLLIKFLLSIPVTIGFAGLEALVS